MSSDFPCEALIRVRSAKSAAQRLLHESYRAQDYAEWMLVMVKALREISESTDAPASVKEIADDALKSIYR